MNDESIVAVRRAGEALALAALMLSLSSCAGTSPSARERDARFEVETTANVRYAPADGLELAGNRLLDVYRPKGATVAPVLLFVHGGAWKLGDKVFHGNVGRAFAARGIVTFSMNYRLAPWTKHPGQVRDVALAFDWVKRNAARYGGDPRNVFLCGHSAGGHLVALLALNDRYLRELGRGKDDIAGVIGLSGLYIVSGSGPVFGGVFADDDATVRDASPAMHVSDRQPPFLLTYAQWDFPGLDAQAIALDDRLRRHGSPSTLLRIDTRGHSTGVVTIGWEDDPTTRAILDFIRENSRRSY